MKLLKRGTLLYVCGVKGKDEKGKAKMTLSFWKVYSENVKYGSFLLRANTI